jgi:D-glycero-D-manno-heptose 1,7-bisphosphate phosphatase
MNRALFLDRDGVINEDYGYVHKIEDFRFRDGIFDVCRSAQDARMKIIVITNQAGIGRGLYSKHDFDKLTEYMAEKLALKNIYLSGIYQCSYHPEHGIGQYKRASFYRKPNPGMLVAACSAHNINPRLSVMIGDKDSDRDAAMAIGIPFYIDASKTGWTSHAESVLGY